MLSLLTIDCAVFFIKSYAKQDTILIRKLNRIYYIISSPFCGGLLRLKGYLQPLMDFCDAYIHAPRLFLVFNIIIDGIADEIN